MFFTSLHTAILNNLLQTEREMGLFTYHFQLLNIKLKKLAQWIRVEEKSIMLCSHWPICRPSKQSKSARQQFCMPTYLPSKKFCPPTCRLITVAVYSVSHWDCSWDFLCQLTWTGSDKKLHQLMPVSKRTWRTTNCLSGRLGPICQLCEQNTREPTAPPGVGTGRQEGRAKLLLRGTQPDLKQLQKSNGKKVQFTILHK